MSLPTSGIITLSRDGRAFTIPVNPPSIPVRRGRAYNEVDVVNYRTVGRFGNRRLAELDITDTFFPAQYDDQWCNYPSLLTPVDSVSLLASWTESDPPGPVFVTVSGTGFGSWMAITDFNTEIRAGEPGDIYYDLHLRTYVNTTVAIFGEAPADPRPAGTGAPQTGTRYTIVGGDTLWGIAKRFYGEGSLWRVIYDANRAVIDSTAAAHGSPGGGGYIFPGTVLTIPPR